MAQLDRWLAQDDGKPITGDGASYIGSKADGGSSSNGFQKDVNELKKILQQECEGLGQS
jgi:hypothetical protein